MAEDYPFPRWEIYYMLIVFPGLVTSSAQIFLMEGVHCRLAGLAGLSFTGAILMAMFLFMLVVVRPSSARRRVVFDASRRGWLIAPPTRSKVTEDDIKEDADQVLVGVVVRMTDWKVPHQVRCMRARACLARARVHTRTIAHTFAHIVCTDTRIHTL